MSGSFWKFSNGFTSASKISTILETFNSNKSDQDESESESEKSQIDESLEADTLKTLCELFDESDLLQELISNNSLLLEFLRSKAVLEYLFELVVNEGSLPSSVDTITDKVAEIDVNKEILDEKASSEKVEVDHDLKEEDTKVVDETENKKSDSEDNDEEEVGEDGEDGEEAPQEEEDQETEDQKHARFATLATEILSADVWSLTDTVMESTSNLNKLWSVLESPEPLSINLSTYFMKIMEHLLDMKCDEMVTYLIENQPNLVKKFVNHLSNPPLMDFLLKLISTDKPDNSTGIIDFLQNQDLIKLLINALDPDDAASKDDIALIRQSSAADLLKALITISANSTTDNSTIGPNELTRELVSYDSMKRLCGIMLKGGYALSNGVGIIIEIIRKNNSDYDILPILYITLDSHPPTGRDPIYLGYLLQVFSEEISKFNDLLLSEHESDLVPESLKTTFGEIEPLGFERFKICELIAELLHCSNMALLNDNKGYDVVKERNDLRNKMKDYDPISFKYNEVIILPNENSNGDESTASAQADLSDDDDFANDTIDSFNSKHDDSILHNQTYDQDLEEPHENANLTEEQLRANPVIGDKWKIALYDTEIIGNIIAMFFKFPWNNFLHNVVFDIVQQVLNGSMDIGFNKFLAIDLFDRADITNKIIYGQNFCSQFEEENNGLRLGYMGHLTLIAEEVVKFIQSYPTNTLSDLIDLKISETSWEDYVNNVLYDTREKYNAILGGGEDDDDIEDDDEDEEQDDLIEVGEDGDGSLFAFNDQKEIEEDEDVNDKSENKNIKKSAELNSDKIDEIQGGSDSENDDDDHFSKYMSQELVNTASAEVSNSVGNKTSDDDASSDEEEKTLESLNDNIDDDYIDPNDDGKSYKKFNSLYDDSGALISEKQMMEEDSDSSSSDSDDEMYNDQTNTSGTKLTRAASKG